jgi:hypothetical protein
VRLDFARVEEMACLSRSSKSIFSSSFRLRVGAFSCYAYPFRHLGSNEIVVVAWFLIALLFYYSKR